MPTGITSDLPPAIADQIAACNARDIDAWMATFAPDALLNDATRGFVGEAAIRAFAPREISGADVTIAVRRVVVRHGEVTVHAAYDGTCDKTGLPAPLIFSPYLTVRDGRVTRLIILRNRLVARVLQRAPARPSSHRRTAVSSAMR